MEKEKYSLLSKEVIKCLRDISIKGMHLDANVLAKMLSQNQIVSSIFTENSEELEKNSVALRHWKDRYVRLKGKCSECSQNHVVTETLQRNIILLIDQIINVSGNPKISADLKEFINIIKNKPNNIELKKCIEMLTAIANRGKNIVSSDNVLANDNLDVEKEANERLTTTLDIETETKKNIYYKLIEGIDLILPNIAKKTQKVKASIESKYAIDKVSTFVDDTSKIIDDQVVIFTDEIEELKSTIMMLLGELNETEKNVVFALKSYNEKMESDSEFNNEISTNLNEIESVFELTNDIKELRESVKERAKSISSGIQKKIEEDLKHTKGVSSELESLKSRIERANSEIDRYKERAKTLETEVNTDPLTGIPNRRCLTARLCEEWERSTRYGQTCSLMVCDLDHFKLINDKYGHLTGDMVLKKVAYMLHKSIRKCDFIGRYGGEEFVVLLPGTDEASALITAEKLRRAVDDAKFFFHKEEVIVTVSIGVAQFAETDDCDTIFEKSDKALYVAKETGRNRVVRYTPEIEGQTTT